MKIKKYIVENENENKTYQNVCDPAKAVLGGKIITLIAYDNEKGHSQVSIASHLKNLEKKK